MAAKEGIKSEDDMYTVICVDTSGSVTMARRFPARYEVSPASDVGWRTSGAVAMTSVTMDGKHHGVPKVTVQYSTVQCSAVQYGTVQYSAARH